VYVLVCVCVVCCVCVLCVCEYLCVYVCLLLLCAASIPHTLVTQTYTHTNTLFTVATLRGLYHTP